MLSRFAIQITSTALVSFGLFHAHGLEAAELAGFPVRTVDTDPLSSPAVADLDGDGSDDVIVAVGDQVFAVRNNGSALPGFPVTLGNLSEDSRKRIFSSPAICALDGLGPKTIVIGGPDNKLYAIQADGTERVGFPIEVKTQISSPPMCADVTGNGATDILIAVPRESVMGFDRRGKKLKGFPVRGIAPAESAFAAGHFEPNGPLELLVGGDDGRLHYFDGKGNRDNSKRASTKYRITGGPSIGDIDGDNVFDVVFGSQDFSVYAVDGLTGQAKKGFPVKTGYRIYGAAALGDLTGDGVQDVVVGSGDGKIYALDGKGQSLSGWPVKVKGKVEGSPAIGDVDLDGENEVVAISNAGFVYILSAKGKPKAGSPIQVEGKLITSPVLVELDGTGGPEIVVAAREKLHAFTVRTRGELAAARIPWPTYGHDAERVSRARPNPASFDDLRVEPQRPLATDALRVIYDYKDLDGDEEAGTRIVWFKNGERVLALEGKKEVDPSFTRKGEKWSVRLQEASDYALFAEGNGARFTKSTDIEILNTPPSAPTIARAGAADATIRTADAIALQITKEAPDVDEDTIQYRTLWSINEVPADLPAGEMTFPAKRAVHGQRVSVVVTPYDGVEEGEPAQLSWTLANTPPSGPKVRFDRSVISKATGATVVIDDPGTDPDGASLSHEAIWTLNGQVLPVAVDTMSVPGSLLARGAKLAVEVRSNDGVATSSSSRAEIMVGNLPPGSAEVALLPAQPTAANPLGLVIAREAADPDGDIPRYLVNWDMNGVPVPELVGAWAVPAAKLKKGQTWKATVVADDGEARGTPATVSTVVGNQLPLAPVVSILPERPLSGEALTLQVRKQGTDPDGEAVTLLVDWLVDGKVLPASTKTEQGLKANIIRKGQRVGVRVTPSDGQESGKATGDSVVVADRAPAPPNISLSPENLRTADEVRVSIVQPGVDPDGDTVAYRYRWGVNGAMTNLPEDTVALPSSWTRQGDRVTVEVISVADNLFSEPVRAERTVMPTHPSAPTVAIEPQNPWPGEPLRVSIVEQTPDDDGAAIVYEIRWMRDGVEALRGTTVSAGVTRKNERWQVEVVAVDTDGRSAPAQASVTIRNRAPIPPQIALSKRVVTTRENVEISVPREAKDPDGDPIRLQTQWAINGNVDTRYNGAVVIPAAGTKKGERWTVSVVAQDGQDAAPAVYDGFFVVNTPPPAVNLRLTPLAPVAGQPISVEIAPSEPDADGDQVDNRIRFLVNGVPAAHDGKSNQLAPSQFSHGDRIVVEVTPFDGEMEGPPSRAETRVNNSPPILSAIEIQPKSPTQADELRCVGAQPATDADDDDVALLVSWEINGRPAGAAGLNATLNGDILSPGTQVRCRAVATDGQALSAELISESVEVKSRGPQGTQVVIYPVSPKTGDEVRCGATGQVTDPDGEQVKLEVIAVLDGKPLPGTVIPADEVKRGRKVGCRALQKDSRASGEEVSIEAVVSNQLPKAPTAELSPPWPRAGIDELQCAVAEKATDPENDKLKYRIEWLKNGKDAKLPPNARVVPASRLKAGEVWNCRLYAQDDEGEGPAGASAAAVVRPNPNPKSTGAKVKRKRKSKAQGAS